MIDPLTQRPILDLMMSGQIPQSGFGRIGRLFQGEVMPEEVARQARFRGLTDAGLSLLSGASEGNLGRGLAGGLNAFQQRMDSDLGSFQERRREAMLDDLTRRSTEESILSSSSARERAEAEEGRRGAAFEQSQEDRNRVLESMRQQVSQIASAQDAHPAEIERAKALLRGGPELQDELDELHKGVVGIQTMGRDTEVSTDAEVERLQRLYEEDPNRRHDRRMEEARLTAYGSRGGAGSDVTSTTLMTHVARQAEHEFEMLLLETGGPFARRMYKEGMEPILPPGVTLRDLRDQADQRALDWGFKLRGDILERRGGGGGAGDGAGYTPSEEKVAAVRQALERSGEESVRTGLRLRGIPESRISKLIELARGQ